MSRWQPTPDQLRQYGTEAQARLEGLAMDARWALVDELGMRYRAELLQMTETALRLGALVAAVVGQPLPRPVNIALVAHGDDSDHIPRWIHRRRIELGAGLPIGALEPPPDLLPSP